MYIEAPVAWPIAVLLDRLLGVHNGTSYKRKELASLVGFHGGTHWPFFGSVLRPLTWPFPDVGGRADEETLNQDEVTIISSVLSQVFFLPLPINRPIKSVFNTVSLRSRYRPS